MERPKRALKPNKRYALEAPSVIPKKLKKKTTGIPVKKIKKFSNVNRQHVVEAVVVPEKKVKRPEETTSSEAPADVEEDSMMRNNLAAQKIKSLIETGETTSSKAPADVTGESMIRNNSAVRKIKPLSVCGDLEPKKSGNNAKNHEQRKRTCACQKHKRKKYKKFTIDCADMELRNVHDVLNFMRCNIKIDGRKNNFGNLKLFVDGNKMIFSGKTDITMQYLKGLAKQFLRKEKLYCVRVINKNPVLKH